MINSFNSVSGSERLELSRTTGFSTCPTGPWLSGRQLLRVRSFAGRAWITLKSPSRRSTHFKVRQELETELGDALVGQRAIEEPRFSNPASVTRSFGLSMNTNTRPKGN